HQVNPYRPTVGLFHNILTSTASGAYPGACPIDTSVSLDVAMANLAKIVGYIATVKMPNGEDPRFLRPKAILCGPRLFPRAVQLTNAKFLAGASGGTSDVEALIKALGYATPTQA